MRAVERPATSKLPTADPRYAEMDEYQFLKDLQGIYLY